jgi:octaprenyl-diphosphate synthase
MLGDGTEAEIAQLRAFGHHFGMAFQIADDLLDFLGDPKKTGKTLGADLRDGRVTLPLLHALSVADSSTRADLVVLVSQPEISDADVAAITGVLARLGGFEAARRAAEARAERAVAALAPLPDSEYRAALERLARYAVSRDR